MKSLFSLGKFCSVTIPTAIALTFANVVETVANPLRVSESQLISSIEKDNQSEPVAIANKLSAETLVGAWIHKTDSGTISRIYYQSDGTWIDFITLPDGAWALYEKGTWQLVDGLLYRRTETGKEYKIKLELISSNEHDIYYLPSNKRERRERIVINSNLSADRLLGTWSIILQDKVAGGLIDNFGEKSILKLIELNPDGTFRYKSSDARFAFNGIMVTRNNGTWEYINNGYADGILVIRNNEGQEIVAGNINWSTDKEFIYVTRSDRDIETNTLSGGKIEKFQRSNLTID